MSESDYQSEGVEEVILPRPDRPMLFKGERYTTDLSGSIEHEHLHRYLFVLSYVAGKAVVDVASGEGYGAALVATRAASVVGIDASKQAVEHARANYRRDNLSFQIGDCASLPLEDASADVVTSFETIEHITDHVAFLSEIKRVLRPGGVAVISTPDRQVYTVECGVRNPYHLRELNREEFRTLLSSHFNHVFICDQKPLTGSVICKETNGIKGPIENFLRIAPNRFLKATSLQHSIYLVALASDSALDQPRISLLEDPQYASHLEQTVIPSLMNRIAELERTLSKGNFSGGGPEPSALPDVR